MKIIKLNDDQAEKLEKIVSMLNKANQNRHYTSVDALTRALNNLENELILTELRNNYVN